MHIGRVSVSRISYDNHNETKARVTTDKCCLLLIAIELYVIRRVNQVFTTDINKLRGSGSAILSFNIDRDRYWQNSPPARVRVPFIEILRHESLDKVKCRNQLDLSLAGDSVYRRLRTI